MKPALIRNYTKMQFASSDVDKSGSIELREFLALFKNFITEYKVVLSNELLSQIEAEKPISLADVEVSSEESSNPSLVEAESPVEVGKKEAASEESGASSSNDNKIDDNQTEVDSDNNQSSNNNNECNKNGDNDHQNNDTNKNDDIRPQEEVNEKQIENGGDRSDDVMAARELIEKVGKIIIANSEENIKVEVALSIPDDLIIEEENAETILQENKDNLISYIFISEFDIDKGSTLKVQYPTSLKPPSTYQADISYSEYIADLMLPDGSQNQDWDHTLFLLNRPPPKLSQVSFIFLIVISIHI